MSTGRAAIAANAAAAAGETDDDSEEAEADDDSTDDVDDAAKADGRAVGDMRRLANGDEADAALVCEGGGCVCVCVGGNTAGTGAPVEPISGRTMGACRSSVHACTNERRSAAIERMPQ